MLLLKAEFVTVTAPVASIAPPLPVPGLPFWKVRPLIVTEPVTSKIR